MPLPVHTFPLAGPLLRGSRCPRVALIGQARAGKSRIFRAASSTVVHHERLAGVGPAYEECQVEVGLDQISLVDLPAVDTFHTLAGDVPVVLKYLLWGDRWPAIAHHEVHQPESSFAAPDVLLLVMDATALERDLELALELAQIGKPMVIALNRMDEARSKRLFINVRALSERLGVPVVPTVAHMGIGLADLFTTVVRAAREKRAPTPQPPSPYIAGHLAPIAEIAGQADVATAFVMPTTFLALQLAENDDYFFDELRCHFPFRHAALLAARDSADAALPRPLTDEIHADRHHRAGEGVHLDEHFVDAVTVDVVPPDCSQVLGRVAQDVLDAYRPAYIDDWSAMIVAVRGLSDSRFVDYVAALTAGGPLVPDDREQVGNVRR